MKKRHLDSLPRKVAEQSGRELIVAENQNPFQIDNGNFLDDLAVFFLYNPVGALLDLQAVVGDIDGLHGCLLLPRDQCPVGFSTFRPPPVNGSQLRLQNVCRESVENLFQLWGDILQLPLSLRRVGTSIPQAKRICGTPEAQIRPASQRNDRFHAAS